MIYVVREIPAIIAITGRMMSSGIGAAATAGISDVCRRSMECCHTKKHRNGNNCPSRRGACGHLSHCQRFLASEKSIVPIFPQQKMSINIPVTSLLANGRWDTFLSNSLSLARGARNHQKPTVGFLQSGQQWNTLLDKLDASRVSLRCHFCKSLFSSQSCCSCSLLCHS